jgi:hypothetical protein
MLLHGWKSTVLIQRIAMKCIQTPSFLSNSLKYEYSPKIIFSEL